MNLLPLSHDRSRFRTELLRFLLDLISAFGGFVRAFIHDRLGSIFYLASGVLRSFGRGFSSVFAGGFYITACVFDVLRSTLRKRPAR